MLSDMDFYKSCDVPGPTKEAIRAIILYKSEVGENDNVVDIGCGTGGITCEFSQRANKVISIDTNPEAIEVTKKNLKKFSLGDNVTLINDKGSNALSEIKNIDIAVVGGSGQELENILEIIDTKLNPNGRIIITAILVDTKLEAINKLKDLGYNPKIMEVNVSNGRILDRGILMISENPIAIITAKKRGN
ncbi:precorrin-6Y C5,15-methyltransferase (decarboxylating) subunit CbiT [Methanobrevibacter oralis]|uniref:precorrin-6Y C5,15-methyltransferase (decarboxylating) subunit CbiT n=1 Tax=Methanobrevibacter oralis TaxID=66851 RepID=UPI001C7385FC|nr:precorrin-6Y C5,15-methyltransferase (decarboxylating) subunit CbiT [Methanobrevibacter oralis]